MSRSLESLQRVLQVETDRRRRAMVDARTRTVTCLGARDRLQRELEEFDDHLRHAVLQTGPPTRASDFHLHQLLEQRLHAARTSLHAAEGAEEKAREELDEARKKAESLARLLARKREAKRARIEHLEQRERDELAVLRAGRRRHEGAR